MSRRRFSTGAPWESTVGYSRAVLVDDRFLYVTGTIALGDEGVIVGIGDPYTQTIQALRIIERVVVEAGGSLDDIARTRIFVTDIDAWAEVGRAHGEMLGHVRPATTMVEISRLIVPEAVVEIEADAVLARR